MTKDDRMRTKPPQEGKRVPLNMRTTQDLRDKIAAAALRSGRSIAQEVEFRLEWSSRDEEIRKVAAEEAWKIFGATRPEPQSYSHWGMH